MKLFFLVLTLIFITATINALSCIHPNKSIDISHDFNLTVVQNKLDKLEPDNEYSACLVQIIIFYYRKNIKINFGTDLRSHDLDINRKVYVETMIELATDTTVLNQGNTINIVEFICNDTNGCDLRFVRDQLKWLFNVNYNKLESAIRPLLIIEDEIIDQLCFNYNQNKEQHCSDGVCYLQYSIERNNIIGECMKTTNIWTTLYVTTFISTEEYIYEEEEEQNEESQSYPQIAILDRFIDYYCRGNNCNNKIIAELVKEAVNYHYDLSEVYKALNVKIEQNSEETSTSATISTKINTTPPIPPSPTTKKPDTTTVKMTGSTTTISTTTTSIITTVKQQNNIATSIDLSSIMIIINGLCFFLF